MSKVKVRSLPKSVPKLAYDAQGCALNPEVTSKDVVEFRNHLGLTQAEFAARFDIPLPTLRKWEQGRSKPVVSQGRVVLYKMLFDEKAKVIVRIDSTRHKSKAA